MGFEANAAFQADFRLSKAWLEEQRVPCSIYAFPNGSYRPEQIEWLRTQGIHSVLLVDERFAHREDSGVYPRLSVSGGSVVELEMAGFGMASLKRLARVS
jgi:hypothetical protein